MMHKLFIRISVQFLLVAVALFAGCKSGNKSGLHSFGFNLQKGKTYTCGIVMDMDQSMMGTKNKIGFITNYSVKVTDDNGSIKTLEAEYTDFKMNMNIMGQELKIDATQPAVPMKKEDIKANPMEFLTSAFSGVIGKKFVMKVDTSGKIIEVTGFESLVSGMIAAMQADEEMQSYLEASLKDQFNADKIKESFSPLFSIYPGRPVKVGDSWERSYELAGNNHARYNTTFTVQSFRENDVLLDTKTKIESLNPEAGNETINLKINGTQTGVMTVNMKNGLVTDAVLSQEFETSGTIKMNAASKIKMTGKEND